jgi:hypothetical protein
VDARAERVAKNEDLFRRINERVEALSQGLDRLTLICECADASCIERLPEVPTAEYEDVRRHADRFFVAPGHERSDVETVLDERPGYLVVVKRGAAGQAARAADPRG